MSERFLLDTNIISEIVNQGRDSVVLGVIAQVGENSICTSAIVASELRFSVERKGSQALREKVERALRNIEILPYASGCSGDTASFVRRWSVRAGDWTQRPADRRPCAVPGDCFGDG